MNTTFWYWKDAKNEWRWHLLAGNNRIIADSGESYKNEQDCLAAISLVKGSSNSPTKKR